MKKIVLAIAAISGIAGCSSLGLAPPKVDTPSGDSRTPINSTSKIEEYRQRTTEEVANLMERTELSRRVDAMNRQLLEMKGLIMMMAMNAESDPKARPVLPMGRAPAVQQPSPATPNSQALAVTPLQLRPAPTLERTVAENETIEARDQSIIFRKAFKIAHTEFNPSRALQDPLLMAAKDAKRIEIRGRTDAESDNPIDRRIALERALNARLFLVKNGIPPTKIRVASMAAGGYIADNSTMEGRARNRRVEIEAMDMNTTAYR